jgi:hypothetical protein
MTGLLHTELIHYVVFDVLKTLNVQFFYIPFVSRQYTKLYKLYVVSSYVLFTTQSRVSILYNVSKV